VGQCVWKVLHVLKRKGLKLIEYFSPFIINIFILGDLDSSTRQMLLYRSHFSSNAHNGEKEVLG
jgi:hypothetical protein